MKKKRILFFDHVAQLSGGERSLLLILKKLNKELFEPVLVTPKEGPLTEAVSEIGIETEIVPFPKVVLERKRKETGITSLVVSLIFIIPGLLHLISIIKRKKIHLIYTNSQKAHLIGLLAGLFLRVPVIWHFRDILHKGAVRRIVRFFVFYFVTHVIAISHAVSEQFNFLDRKSKKVSVFYNAIDMEDFFRKAKESKVDLRRENSIPDDSILVAAVGQIAKWKGQEYLIYVAKELVKKYKNVYFFIIGKPLFLENEYNKKLVNLVSKYNIEGRVFLTGFRTDIEGVMNDIDILLHTPIEPEPFGRVLIEAMAGRALVVSFDIGAIREVVSEEIGFLIKPFDRKKLLSVVSSLIEDGKLRKKLGMKSRSYVEKRFGSKVLINEVVKILQNFSKKEH